MRKTKTNETFPLEFLNILTNLTNHIFPETCPFQRPHFPSLFVLLAIHLSQLANGVILPSPKHVREPPERIIKHQIREPMVELVEHHQRKQKSDADYDHVEGAQVKS